jgi:hypothetical protein
MDKKIRITALAVLLALSAVSTPLCAQEWLAWEGKDNADKKAWDEMGQWYIYVSNRYYLHMKDAPPPRLKAQGAFGVIDSTSSIRISSNSYSSDSVHEKIKSIKEFYSSDKKVQSAGVKFWKKNKADYEKMISLEEINRLEQAEQAKRAELEQAKQAAAEKVKRDAEEAAEEAARNDHLPDKYFNGTRDVTKDGKGIIIESYQGMAPVVKIPALIEGFPVREIGREAFSDASIARVVIPEGVTSIKYAAFRSCRELTQITLPSTLKYIEDDAFSGCTSLVSITIPNSVTSIGARTFNGCTSLASITIPNGDTSISSRAFGGCTSLASVTIPDSVRWIGDDAFRNCTNLASITIPDSVTEIGSSAFGGCTSLTTVTISPIQRRFGSAAFGNCPLGLVSKSALRVAGYTGGFD